MARQRLAILYATRAASDAFCIYLLYLLEQVCHHCRPAGLVAGTHATPGITVEVLVEGDVITPARIVLKGRIGAKDRPVTLLVTQKDARQPSCEFICDLSQR